MTHDPKSAELSAAVERLRRDKQGEEVYVKDNCTDLSGFMADLETLADAYLATVATDDGEPITEEWLSSFMRIGGGGSFIHSELPGYVESSDSGEFWRWVVESMILCVMNTRGEVRRVFAALNIALQPIAQEQASDGEAK